VLLHLLEPGPILPGRPHFLDVFSRDIRKLRVEFGEPGSHRCGFRVLWGRRIDPCQSLHAPLFGLVFALEVSRGGFVLLAKFAFFC
jgi:hypothetical protein